MVKKETINDALESGNEASVDSTGDGDENGIKCCASKQSQTNKTKTTNCSIKDDVSLKDSIELKSEDLHSSQKENCCDIDIKEKRLIVRKRKSDSTSCEPIDKKSKTAKNETESNICNLCSKDEGDSNSNLHLVKRKSVSDKFDDHELHNTDNESENSKSNPVLTSKKKQKIISHHDSERKLSREKPAQSLSQKVNDTAINSLDDDEHSQQVGDGNEDEDKSSEFRTPYYLENFRTVLKTVFGDKNNSKLYNSDDMEVISTFNGLSGTLIYFELTSK